MKRLSLLAFTLILSCGHRSNDNDNGLPFFGENNSTSNPSGEDTGASGSAVPKLTSCYQGDAWTCAVEAAVVVKTNALRSGLKPLTESYETAFVARAHSLDMVARNHLDHNGFAAERVKVLQTTFPDLKFFFTAENVAFFTTGSDPDPEAVAQTLVDMWWNSPGHRNNMLGKHTYLGVGIARSKGAIYGTQLFH